MTEPKKTDQETRLLAAMAYGEASAGDVAEEMSALASVLVRQRAARGYTSISTFASSDRTFSFVVKDGNERYRKLINASEAQLEKDSGMNAAVAAAKNALAGGPDLSNGAYFWDGGDIKTNYKIHFKVRNGIRFSQPGHNIYGISESTKLIILNKTIVKKSKGKVISTETAEVGRYDHVYVSTAAFGGTIFWKNNQEYMTVTGAKAHK
jgi:hypothetical protein